MFTATTSRFAALALAATVTLAMLAGIGALADGQVAHAQLAAATASATRA
jgi:hypothetical protein